MVARVKEMKPLPPKEKVPFSVNPYYKKTIDDILAKLVDVDMENGPYKIVLEQKKLREELAQRYTLLASQKFRLLMGGNQYFTASHSNLHGYNNMLMFQQCQYDNWDAWHEKLNQHCKIDEWKDRNYDKFPIAYWDVSSDQDFEKSEQKVFPIRLSYYDSHESGY